jgi:hypothetical protein
MDRCGNPAKRSPEAEAEDPKVIDTLMPHLFTGIERFGGEARHEVSAPSRFT